MKRVNLIIWAFILTVITIFIVAVILLITFRNEAKNTTSSLPRVNGPTVGEPVTPYIMDRDLRTLPPATPYDCGKCTPITDRQILSNPHVIESRRILLSYGFSEEFFNSHFNLVHFSLEDDYGRVVWLLKVDPYQTIVDSGFVLKLDSKGNVQEVQHGIEPRSDFKGPTVHDIRKVVSKKEAEKGLSECLGEFHNETVKLNLRGGYYSVAQAGESVLVLEGFGEFVCPGPFSKAPCVPKKSIVDLENGKIVKCES